MYPLLTKGTNIAEKLYRASSQTIQFPNHKGISLREYRECFLLLHHGGSRGCLLRENLVTSEGLKLPYLEAQILPLSRNTCVSDYHKFVKIELPSRTKSSRAARSKKGSFRKPSPRGGGFPCKSTDKFPYTNTNVLVYYPNELTNVWYYHNK